MSTDLLVKINTVAVVILFAWTVLLSALRVELPSHVRHSPGGPGGGVVPSTVYTFTLSSMGKTPVIAECAGVRRFTLCCDTAVATICNGGSELGVQMVKTDDGHYAVINGPAEFLNAQCRLYCQRQ